MNSQASGLGDVVRASETEYLPPVLTGSIVQLVSALFYAYDGATRNFWGRKARRILTRLKRIWTSKYRCVVISRYDRLEFQLSFCHPTCYKLVASITSTYMYTVSHTLQILILLPRELCPENECMCLTWRRPKHG